MTPEEFQRVYPALSRWIGILLATFRERARSVAPARFPRLPEYYPVDILERAKFVVVPRIPVPPLSQMGLSQYSAFETADFGGITYLDTFFVKEGQATETLFFHELVHVIQWGELGPEKFLAAYADGLEKWGYAASPLEAMAYNAQSRFERGTDPFDVVNHVKEELSKLSV